MSDKKNVSLIVFLILMFLGGFIAQRKVRASNKSIFDTMTEKVEEVVHERL